MYKHKVTQLVLSEEGYLEKSRDAVYKDPSVLYSKKRGSGFDNYTKYGKEMHDIYPKVMDYPAYWCDGFVDWCFYKTYGVANAKGLLGGDFDDYTKGSINLYKKKNAFYLRSQIVPEEGDQIFFSKDGTFDGVHHTGFVYAVDSSYVYTTEGNTSNSSEVDPNGGGVWNKRYALNDYRIYGYGRPLYSKYEHDSVKTYSKGAVVKPISYVTKNGESNLVKAELTILEDIVIRSKPDFSVRDAWYRTNDGYISAYRVAGWVRDNKGWWCEMYDHKYPRSKAAIIDGKEYHFDRDGYMLESNRIDQSGAIIY